VALARDDELEADAASDLPRSCARRKRAILPLLIPVILLGGIVADRNADGGPDLRRSIARRWHRLP
jgi:hypothetical protein